MKEQLIERSKCKIIATVGPASSDAPIITKMIDAGLDVVRINFSHGTEDWHANLIEVIRDTSIKKRLLLPIMGDLPGPKIRLGKLNPSPILLTKGQKFVLTEEEIVGSWETASINLKGFTSLVKERDSIFINDGEVELIVERIDDKAIVCEVVMGGEIGSHKGVNLPNTELGIEIFTEADQRWVEFAAKHEIEILCQSFVSKPEDIKQLREYAAALGYKPFIIAKIERKLALKHLDGIIEEADGIMIARGDLGVELPLEQIPVFQRQIIHKAIIAGKPVITATQMLESMKINRRPTRA
ncbi:MAG: pyruvate kinase, partial [candidate division WOR-3 bacterium]